MRKAIVVVSVLFFGLLSASAQKNQVQDKWDVFAGYNLAHGYIANAPESPLTLNGGETSLTYYFTKHAGATAEFAGMTGTIPSTTQSMTNYRYAFGPTVRFDLQNGRYELFAHQLFGVTHLSFSGQTETANPFTMISGGGLDVKLSRRLSIRPFEMDYFAQQVAVDALAGGQSNTGVKISVDGFNYTAGAVLHF